METNVTARRSAVRRLALVVVTGLMATGALAASGLVEADEPGFPAATPAAVCGPGALPETGVQGRVPTSDYTSGRVLQGYQCNAEQVSHQGSTGGFKVLRYVDQAGHTCAYYDTTRLFPTDLPLQAQTGLGLSVLDMANPAAPVLTDNIVTPTMLSPHESVLLNEKRGLLAAVMGNPATSLGILEVYDLSKDCRKPVLASRTVEPIFGHESGWSPDGLTFWATGTTGQTLVAYDLTDPTKPRNIFEQLGVNYHGVRLSDDGRTMYVANIGNDLSGARFPSQGLRVMDVSEVQDRVPNPKVKILSDLTWPEGSIPQVAQPFTRDGRQYVLQDDEFARFGLNGTSIDAADAPVGAARIIDVQDPRHPAVVSNIRLQVQQPTERKAASQDPGAGSPVGGYTTHYCSVPYRDNPQIAACSMIGSGLRIFDISDLAHPREAAYFNRPQLPADPVGATAAVKGGANALSQPAWDLANQSVWYSDGSSGFYAVRLTNGVGDLLRAAPPVQLRSRISLLLRKAWQVRGKERQPLRFIVRAGGAPVGTGRVRVYTDGALVKKVDLATTGAKNGFRTYRLPKNLAFGKHRFRLAYTSDNASLRTSARSRRVAITVVRTRPDSWR